MTLIKAVFFDAVDTLFRVRGSVGQVYARVAEAYGVKANAESLDRAFLEVFAHAPPPVFPGAATQDILHLEKTYWFRIVRAVFDRVQEIPLFDDYFHDLYQTFRRAEAWEVFPETAGVLSHLHTRGIQLGVISNFDSRIFDVFEALGLRRYVNAFFISSRIGVAKPDARIFHAALDGLQCHPAEALFVGDCLYDDMTGAAAAGLIPILVDRRHRHRSAPAPHRVISDLYPLRDLPALLR